MTSPIVFHLNYKQTSDSFQIIWRAGTLSTRIKFMLQTTAS